jgi:hypothetical protein
MLSSARPNGSLTPPRGETAVDHEQPVTAPGWSDHVYRVALSGLLTVAAVVMFATSLDYGLSWDEEWQSIYGELLIRWYQSFGRDRAALSFSNTYLYGGFFELIAQSVGRVFPFGVYEGRHAATIAFGLAGVWATARLGALVGGSRVALLAALFLLTTPLYYGHSMFNSKDIPFAGMSTWFLVALFSSVKQVPNVSWTHVVGVGVALGLTLGVRVGGIFHWAYVALFWGVALIVSYGGRHEGKGFARDSWRLLCALGLVLVMAWAIMAIFWPFAQSKPLSNPLFAIRDASQFDFKIEVLFNGRLVDSQHVPWTYVPGYLGVHLPEFYFLGWLAGIAAAVTRWWRGRQAPPRRALAHAGMLLVVVLFPIVVAVVLKSTIYDGVRHFLFVLPPLAVLAAWGLSTALDTLQPRWARYGLAAVTAALVLVVGIEMARLHPYQYVYFNRLVAGGLEGADGRFETDYWGTSYREAAEWVFANYRPPAGVTRKIRVQNCSDRFLHDYFLSKSPAWRARFETQDPPDIFLTTTRWNCHTRQHGTLLHVVRRKGVALAYVFEVAAVRAP